VSLVGVAKLAMWLILIVLGVLSGLVLLEGALYIGQGILPRRLDLREITQMTRLDFPPGTRVVRSRYRRGLLQEPESFYAELTIPRVQVPAFEAGAAASGLVLDARDASKEVRSHEWTRDLPGWWLKPEEAASAGYFEREPTSPRAGYTRMLLATTNATRGEVHVYLWWSSGG